MRLANLKAFSLIEIMLAMTIVVIAIIPLMGLIPLGLKNSHTSSEEIHAAHLLQMIAQDFKHTPVTQSKSAILNLELPPDQASSNNDSRRAWIDLSFNVYLTRPPFWAYEVEWTYLQVPSPAESFTPIECELRIIWPPKPSDSDSPSKSAGEISTRLIFPQK